MLINYIITCSRAFHPSESCSGSWSAAPVGELWSFLRQKEREIIWFSFFRNPLFEEVTGLCGVFQISPIYVGTAAHPALPSESGKDFFTFPILTKRGKKKIKALVCLADFNSQHLGRAKQMTEKHPPAGAVTPQPLSGLAAFLPHFPGSQNVLELLPGGFGAGKLISAQPSPG